MSEIVIGVGASHTTLMNTRWDEVDHLEAAHAFRNGLATARTAIAETTEPTAHRISSNTSSSIRGPLRVARGRTRSATGTTRNPSTARWRWSVRSAQK